MRGRRSTGSTCPTRADTRRCWSIRRRSAPGGKHAEIDQFAPSQDGALVAYGISVGGSENSTLHVIETATRVVRPDTIDRAQFAGVSWAPDGRSFFLTRLPAGSATATPDQQYAHMRVYRHVLGTDPSADTTVLDSDHLPFAFKAAAVFPSVSVNPGSAYALALISDGVSPEVTLYSAPLAALLAGHPAWRPVVAQADGVIGVAVRGDRIDLLTHAGAPRFRIAETSLATPDFATARTIVPQGDGVLTAPRGGAGRALLRQPRRCRVHAAPAGRGRRAAAGDRACRSPAP